jgi:hypothetical protein
MIEKTVATEAEVAEEEEETEVTEVDIEEDPEVVEVDSEMEDTETVDHHNSSMLTMLNVSRPDQNIFF